LHRHPEEALHFAPLADDGHAVDERNRVQQVTQINKSPDPEAEKRERERERGGNRLETTGRRRQLTLDRISLDWTTEHTAAKQPNRSWDCSCDGHGCPLLSLCGGFFPLTIY